jgi:hypothetical protein
MHNASYSTAEFKFNETFENYVEAFKFLFDYMTNSEDMNRHKLNSRHSKLLPVYNQNARLKLHKE